MNTQVEFKPDVRYAYATGRVRVLETKLLSSQKVEKMIESRTINDALIYLEDTAYDDTLGEMKNPGEYGELVKAEKSASLELMERLLLDDVVKQLFRISYDFHNIKSLLKGRLSSLNVSDILSDFGTVPVNLIKEAFETENFNPLPEFMKDVIGQALAHYYLKKSLKSMEFLIDNLEYNFLLSLSEETQVPFLVNYIMMKIDIANISTFLRIKYFDIKDVLEETLIGGGMLSTKFFHRLFGESIESIPSLFRNTPYFHLVEEGVRKIIEKDTFSALDRESENYIMRYIGLTRYVTFGVEPVAAYFVSRAQDLKIIKMVLLGKLNQMPIGEIKERIPITFN